MRIHHRTPGKEQHRLHGHHIHGHHSGSRKRGLPGHHHDVHAHEGTLQGGLRGHHHDTHESHGFHVSAGVYHHKTGQGPFRGQRGPSDTPFGHFPHSGGTLANRRW